jgi:hypothetical protein
MPSSDALFHTARKAVVDLAAGCNLSRSQRASRVVRPGGEAKVGSSNLLPHLFLVLISDVHALPSRLGTTRNKIIISVLTTVLVSDIHRLTRSSLTPAGAIWLAAFCVLLGGTASWVSLRRIPPTGL